MQFNEQSDFHKEKEQKPLKDYINVLAYYGKEHLLKGTVYYERFISHIAFFKLLVLKKEKITKSVKVKGVQTVKEEIKDFFYVDPKFECLKISKTKKSDKEPLPPPAKTSQVENIFVHFNVENKVAYTRRKYKDAPKKFFAPTKSILNYFSILLEIYISEITGIFKNVDIATFDLNFLVKEGKFSKLVYLISKIDGRSILERVKFDRFNNEMASRLFELEQLYVNGVNKTLLNLTTISGDQKNQLTKLFVNFVCVLMMYICTQKATRAEKKYTADLDCFLNFLQYHHFLNKHDLQDLNINDLMTLIREGDKKIVTHIAKLKNKDEVPVEDRYFEDLNEFKEFEEQYLKKVPKLNNKTVEVKKETIYVNKEETEEEKEDESEEGEGSEEIADLD